MVGISCPDKSVESAFSKSFELLELGICNGEAPLKYVQVGSSAWVEEYGVVYCWKNQFCASGNISKSLVVP